MKIYLATPYSHPDQKVIEWRFKNINKVASILMMTLGETVFSPISHSHHIATHINNSLAVDFWLNQDVPLMDWADRMVIAKFFNDPDPLACYDSYGLNFEIEYMESLGKPITCIEVWGDCEI